MGCCATKIETIGTAPRQDTAPEIQLDENIIFNEQPFLIKGDMLKQLLHRSIGALTFVDEYKNIHAGSATLISPDTLITAAHNLYNKGYGSYNSKFKFYLGADGVGERYHEVEAWRIPQKFQNCPVSAKLKYDYGIMKIKKPILFDEYLSLSQVCAQCLYKNKERVTLKIYGFPCAYPCASGDPPGYVRSFQGNFKALDNLGRKLKLYQYGLTRQDKILLVDSSQLKIGYAMTTLPGQSGCPVVIGKRIIAIHVGGDKAKFNIGRIIDPEFIENVEKWAKQLGLQTFSVKKQKICDHQKLLLKSSSIYQEPPSEASKQQINEHVSAKKEDQIQQISLKQNNQPQLDQQPVKCQEEQLKMDKNCEVINIPIEEKQQNIQPPLQLPPNQRLEKQFICDPKEQIIKIQEQQVKQRQIIKPIKDKINPTYCLDLSKRSLKSVDLLEYTNLTNLSLFDNMLHLIDLSHCKTLKQLRLSGNMLKQIDLTNNIELTMISVSNNQLQSVDLRNSINLESIFLENNKLSKINVDSCIKLQCLCLGFNQLCDIDLRNNVKLRILYLYHNQLQKVDLRTNTNIFNLQLYDNKLHSIDISTNIKLSTVYLEGNKLEKIVVGKNIKLRQLKLSKNQLRQIDVSANIRLTHLFISHNKIQTIKCQKLYDITHLKLASNTIKSIDLSINTCLQYLNLSNNIIENLDLSKNRQLTWLQLQNNKLNKVLLSLSRYAAQIYTNPQLFNLSNQQSNTCQVQLICNKWPYYPFINQKDALSFVNRLKARYFERPWYNLIADKNPLNLHNCSYSFNLL